MNKAMHNPHEQFLNWLHSFARQHNIQRGFTSAATVTIGVDFDNAEDDYRRMRAEQWCEIYCSKQWKRTPDRLKKTATFEFESEHDATLFKMWHG